MNSCLLFWEVCSILLQAAWFVSAPAAAGKKVLSLWWPPALLPCIPKISRITGFTSLRQKQDSEMWFFPHEWRASCLWVHTVGASRQVNLNGWNLALIPGKRALFLEMLCATYSSLGTIFRPSCHQLAASRWEIQSLAIPFIHSTAFLYIDSVIPFRLGCFFRERWNPFLRNGYKNTSVWACSRTVQAKASQSEIMGLNLLKMHLWSSLATLNLFRRGISDYWYPLPTEFNPPGKMDNYVSFHIGMVAQVRPPHSVGHKVWLIWA